MQFTNGNLTRTREHWRERKISTRKILIERIRLVEEAFCLELVTFRNGAVEPEICSFEFGSVFVAEEEHQDGRELQPVRAKIRRWKRGEDFGEAAESFFRNSLLLIPEGEDAIADEDGVIDETSGDHSAEWFQKIEGSEDFFLGIESGDAKFVEGNFRVGGNGEHVEEGRRNG